MRRTCWVRITAFAMLSVSVPGIAAATEGALGRPIAGTAVTSKVHVEATLTVNTLAQQVSQISSRAFDLFFTPITARYHISENENFSVGLGVWAPTGDYDSTRLSNTSLNNWTFIPTFSYTKAIPEHLLEFDATTGVQFYSENKLVAEREAQRAQALVQAKSASN